VGAGKHTDIVDTADIAEEETKEKMEEMIANERKDGSSKTYFGKENFHLYYALGPELEEVNSNEFENDDMEEITSDFDEDVGDSSGDAKQIGSDDSLSDDSGTVDEKEWKGCSIPPDIVASANQIKVIKVEPKTKDSNIISKGMLDQDITDFRRHQVEAYTNLEDLLDKAWDESDLAPAINTQENANVKNEREDLMKQVGLAHANNHCVPVCSKCSIM